MRIQYFKRICLIAFIFLFLNAIDAAYAENTELIYIETKSKNIDQLEKEIDKLHSFGIHVYHIFPPNTVLARINHDSELDFYRFGFKKLHYPKVIFRDGTKPKNKIAFSAWKYILNQIYENNTMQSKTNQELTTYREKNHIPQDDIFYYESESLRISKADGYTSQFMIGRSAIKIILMESIANGVEDENWTKDQEDLVVAEIVKGADYL